MESDNLNLAEEELKRQRNREAAAFVLIIIFRL